MALSAYMTELQSFNVIDKDHRKRDAWVEENGERCRRDATAHSGMLEGVSLDEIELSDSSKKKMEKPIIADLNLL
jgi:hypothetical protein